MPYLSMTRTTGVGSRLLVLFVKMKERKDCMTRRMREKYSDEKCFNQPKNITRYDFGSENASHKLQWAEEGSERGRGGKLTRCNTM
jgi:hypothetical protein